MKLFLKIIAGLLVAVVLGFGGLMFFKGMKSKDIKLANIGMENGRLIKCGPKPNCVCSIGNEDSEKHHIAPLEFANDDLAMELWQKIKGVMNSQGFQLVSEKDDYLHYTHTSTIMGFVDDIEFHRPQGAKRIDLKSSSRVGYSDLGANRKRLTKIVLYLKQAN